MVDDDVQSLTEQSRRYHADLRKEDYEWLAARGISAETADSALLGYVAEGRFRGSISIPYLLPYGGGTKTIRFRYLNPVRNKYDGIKGKAVHLYGVGNTLNDDVWVCEGEFDALVLSQAGYPAVGVPGASSFKPDWKYLFANTNKTTLVFDSDDAGTRGANRIASVLGEVVEDVRIVRLPEGSDVTDVYLRDPRLLTDLLEG